MIKRRLAEDGKVLLVAAGDAVLRVFAARPEFHPWRLLQAECGEQLLELLQGEAVDVTLVDVDRPGGAEVAALLRRQHPELPLIITGSAATRSSEPGGIYLPSPLEPAALLAALEELSVPTLAFHRLVASEGLARDHLEDLLLIRQVSEAVHTSKNLPAFLEELVSRIMVAVGVRHCSLMLCRADGKMEIAAARGLPEEVVASTLIAPGEGVAGQVLASGEPLLIADLETSDRFDLVSEVDRYLTSSLLSVPLVSRGQVHGVLNVNNKQTGAAFSAIDLHLLSGVAHQAMLAIENFRLVAELQQSGQDLERSNQRLQQLLQGRSRLVCNLSHELKTPLTSVLGYVDLVLSHFEELDTGELLAYLQRVQDESLQMKKLINGMLTLFSLESGAGGWVWETLDPAAALREQLSLRQSDIAELGLQLEVQIEATVACLQADRKRLNDLLAALLDNGIKFNCSGGRLFVSLCNADSGGLPGVEFRIFNEGTSVPPEAAEQIFDQYTQLGGIESGKPTGIGVGLAICRSIVDHFSGHISLLPSAADGTMVAIWLPIENSEAHNE